MEDTDTTKTDEEKLIEELCTAFQYGDAEWFFNDDVQVSSVIFYTAAIRFIRKKPFDNPAIQHRVLTFLEMMLDNATEKLLMPAMERLDLVIEKTKRHRQVCHTPVNYERE